MQYCQLITRTIPETVNLRWQAYTVKTIKENNEWKSLLVPADDVRRGHMNSESPSVHPSVRPRFPTIIWKSCYSINFKSGVRICWVSVQNWFALAQFYPSSGLKTTENGSKWWFPTIIWKKVFTQSTLTLWCTLVGFIKICLGENKSSNLCATIWWHIMNNPMAILGLHLANERHRYKVKSSLTGWVQT